VPTRESPSRTFRPVRQTPEGSRWSRRRRDRRSPLAPEVRSSRRASAARPPYGTDDAPPGSAPLRVGSDDRLSARRGAAELGLHGAARRARPSARRSGLRPGLRPPGTRTVGKPGLPALDPRDGRPGLLDRRLVRDRTTHPRRPRDGRPRRARVGTDAPRLPRRPRALRCRPGPRRRGRADRADAIGLPRQGPPTLRSEPPRQRSRSGADEAGLYGRHRNGSACHPRRPRILPRVVRDLLGRCRRAGLHDPDRPGRVRARRLPRSRHVTRRRKAAHFLPIEQPAALAAEVLRLAEAA
jgi:hypothetical protein